jgi:hypothetical protein
MKQHALNRREFLGAAGVITASAASLLAQVPDTPLVSGDRTLASLGTRSDRFSRIFPGLRPFAEPSSALERALLEIGAPGGVMDAKDPLQEGPIRLITEPLLSAGNRDSTSNTAGVTFIGQFLDHDMTFDTSSPLGVPTRPEQSTNTRTSAFDLDSVYGGGPVADPRLYRRDDRAKFKLESGGLFEDLPRESDGTAIIADPRNDENLIIAGLQAAFLAFHNRIVDLLRRGGRRQLAIDEDRLFGGDEAFTRGDVFAEARRVATWHYQWMIVNEFLPNIIGAQTVNDILLRGRRYYTPRAGSQSIPVEFQGAAYRFGHSMVRPSYRANLAGDRGGPFFGFIFDPAGEDQADPVDLRGGCRAPRRFIGWQTFFNFGGAQATNVRPSKVIDTRISTPLFNLPLGAIASGAPPTSLPQRNLLRHVTWSLPSGQAIAREMRIPALTPSQLPELAKYGIGLEHNSPLWYYVLKEAELAGGATLVGVGARIVGEVFLGLLSLNRNSYLARNPGWRPRLPSRTPGTFGMVDLLTFAGVDPLSRGQ